MGGYSTTTKLLQQQQQQQQQKQALLLLQHAALLKVPLQPNTVLYLQIKLLKQEIIDQVFWIYIHLEKSDLNFNLFFIISLLESIHLILII